MTGFVFELPPVIPVWAVLALVSAVAPSLAPVPYLMSTYVLPRRKPAGPLDDPAPWRAAFLLEAAVLGLATLGLAVGSRPLAWVVALPAAVHGALAGVGGVCIGCNVFRRRQG